MRLATFTDPSWRRKLGLMLIAEEELEEFVRLCQECGETPSEEEAREAATRLVLLYERLLMPTPSETSQKSDPLAKSRAPGTLSDGPVEPTDQPIP